MQAQDLLMLSSLPNDMPTFAPPFSRVSAQHFPPLHISSSLFPAFIQGVEGKGWAVEASKVDRDGYLPLISWPHKWAIPAHKHVLLSPNGPHCYMMLSLSQVHWDYNKNQTFSSLKRERLSAPHLHWGTSNHSQNFHST